MAEKGGGDERRKGAEDECETQRERLNEQVRKATTAQSNVQVEMVRRRQAGGVPLIPRWLR